MLKLPENINNLDIAFGNIDHMPSYDTVPDQYKVLQGNPYVDLVKKWFYDGLDDLSILEPKDGINKVLALAAIRSVLCSYEPKHEHKMAACAYMLSEWFKKPSIDHCDV
jgi:hypothetical protein